MYSLNIHYGTYWITPQEQIITSSITVFTRVSLPMWLMRLFDATQIVVMQGRQSLTQKSNIKVVYVCYCLPCNTL